MKLDEKPLGFWAVQKVDYLKESFQSEQGIHTFQLCASAYWLLKRLGGTELDGKFLWNVVRGFDSAFAFLDTHLHQLMLDNTPGKVSLYRFF